VRPTTTTDKERFERMCAVRPGTEKVDAVLEALPTATGRRKTAPPRAAVASVAQPPRIARAVLVVDADAKAAAVPPLAAKPRTQPTKASFIVVVVVVVERIKDDFVSIILIYCIVVPAAAGADDDNNNNNNNNNNSIPRAQRTTTTTKGSSASTERLDSTRLDRGTTNYSSERNVDRRAAVPFDNAGLRAGAGRGTGDDVRRGATTATENSNRAGDRESSFRGRGKDREKKRNGTYRCFMSLLSPRRRRHREGYSTSAFFCPLFFDFARRLRGGGGFNLPV